MDCEALKSLLGKRDAGELGEEQRENAEAHLATCPACRERWAAAYQSAVLYKATAPQQDPCGIKDTVLARLSGETPAPGTGEPGVPEHIAGFEVLGFIGRGGMGNVFRARQVSMARVVALKILPPRLAGDKDFVDRFIREAHAAAKLSHPHIVQGYDAGHADGYYYFAMEYVDGEGLDAIVARDGPLEPDRALKTMKQACSALWAAHEAGVIHRDIKPSNIMLDSKGDVRVTDFGLAKCIEGDLSACADEHPLGTPAYVAPEVAAGKPADARSDLYSLAAAFFHVLSGRPLFQGGGLTEVIAKQMNAMPPALGEVAPWLDPRLCRIIDRLLRKDPDERPASAQELLGALEALGPLQSPAQAARAEGRAMIQAAATMPLSAGHRLQRQAALASLQQQPWVKRRAGVLAVSAAALLLAVGVIVALTRPWGRTQEQARAVAPGTAAMARPVEPREHNAEAIFRAAEDAAALMEWDAAKKHLTRLDEQCSDTKFYSDHVVGIGRLRAKINAALLASEPPPAPAAKPDPPRPAGELIAEVALPARAEAADHLPWRPGEWVALFDGKTLKGWQVLRHGGFARGGPVRVEDGRLLLGRGAPRTGIAWTGDVPREDYEIAVTARREAGNDSFCGLYFPIGDSVCTLSVGGYGGRWIGLANVDGRNPTQGGVGRQMTFGAGRWYHIRLRVTKASVRGWVNDEQVFDVPRRGHTFTPSLGDVPTKLAVITWETTAGIEDVRMRPAAPEPPEQPGQWVSLFGGNDLEGWRVVEEFPNAPEGLGDGKGGNVTVADGAITIERGSPLSGIAWAGDFPTMDYEVLVEAMQVKGREDFCILAMPVGDVLTTFHVGAYAGTLVGFHRVDGKPLKPENPTTKPFPFQRGQWYRIRVQVTRDRLAAWLGDEPLFDLDHRKHKVDGTWDIHHVSRPFGISTWNTQAAVRDIRLRRLGRRPAVGPAPALPEEPNVWATLFDGETLNGWKKLAARHYANRGPVRVRDGSLALGRGDPHTAIEWLGEFPTVDYEVTLEARRDPGSDACWYVCLPVPEGAVRLDVGERQGTFLGLSSVDGQPCQYNDTGREASVPIGRWSRVRARVTEARIEAWLDDEKVVDLARPGRRLAMPHGEADVRSLALGTRAAAASFRNIRVQRLPGKPEPPPEGGVALKEATVPLSARAGWLDTGLYLRKGQTYEVAATGRWGHRPGNALGPDGEPRNPKRYVPIAGPRAYDLIGRVGRHGRAFPIGGKRRLEPAQSGRLYLRMNDDSWGDNWGSLRVRVQGPLVAAKGAPLLSRFSKVIANAKVGHQSGWASTGIEVQPGDRFLIRAEGTHQGGPRGAPLDADGFDGERSHQRAAALIGRIGHHGARFPVCRLLLLQAEEPGMLYLAVNSTPRPVLAPRGLWRLPEPRPKPKPVAKAKQDGRPPRQPPNAPAAIEEIDPLPNRNTLAVTILAPEDFDPRQPRPKNGADLRGEPLLTLQGHSSWVISIDFSPDGTLLASAGRDRIVRIWHLPTGKCLRLLRGHRQIIESVAFSPDGKHLLSTGGDRTLRLWDVATGEPARVVQAHEDWARAATFFPGGARVASADSVGVVGVWDAGGAWQLLRTLRCQGGCWAVLPFRGGDRLAAATEKGEIRIWDPHTGNEERAFFARMTNCWSLAVSPDGQRLAAAGDDPVVRVWDAATGERLAALPAHGMIRSVAFSPDGKLLAAGGGDRTVRFWDATSYHCLRSLEGHSREVRDIAFSPDSTRLATASFDGTIRIWTIEFPARPEARPAPPEAEKPPERPKAGAHKPRAPRAGPADDPED